MRRPTAPVPVFDIVLGNKPVGGPDHREDKNCFAWDWSARPNAEHSGPATAIVVNDAAYLIDLGPGIVRRASAAFGCGIGALEPTRLRVAFITHLHSDHTLGCPDLIFTPWTIGRRVPLEVYGPKGLKAMTEDLQKAYRVDIETRTNADGNQRGTFRRVTM
jgi:ribonuclease BN (tRNA processing enzyme)